VEGTLKAMGTAAQTITFTSALTTPAPGSNVLTLTVSPESPQKDYALLAVAIGGGRIQTAPSTLAVSAFGVGDPIPRIQCQPGYTATLYAQGLASPDGLAFDPSGVLYVAEEEAGRVSRIEPGGSITTVISGLASPEGIAFDTIGNLYVVEDTQAGRVVKRAFDGVTTTLATNLDAPEGIVWASDGTLYITESNAQFTSNPTDLRARIAAISSSGAVTRIITNTPTIIGTNVTFWSYSGLTIGTDGLLYVANETSGTELTRTVIVIPGVLTVTFTLSTTDSIFAVNPATGARTLFASGLVAPEGLRFATSGGFPLYVAEEDIGGGASRLSRAETDGSHTPFCTGFYTIEDVVLDGSGRLYVSEDGSGWIIVIERAHKVYLPVVSRAD